MDSTADRAIAIVGLGAILPDAPNAPAFWKNIKDKRYSISDVPSERWSPANYYNPDPSVPDKTYSKIGGWVRGFVFDWQRFRIPPKVAAAMDEGQQWAVTIAAEALADYGYPDRPLNTENTGVILGTAMGGELHYQTHLRISYPEYIRALEAVGAFQGLPAAARDAIVAGMREQVERRFPPITEDSMPGELPNIVAGRVANVLNLRGPSFITDAACASTFAAIDAAVEMLDEGHVDAVIAGGVDRNMGSSTFIKFCKIGALSATGTRPFGDGADGFVMGEGSGVFVLKRLADAERDGDKIYAVIRGVGASSDGKGKGITAPNPVGQVLAIQRAWKNAGLDPASATLVEAHGTSTKVGDVVEVESLAKVFGGAERGRIAIGSAKSNIGHLKAGAGAAGMLKTVMALHEKILPPTLNSEKPNPNINFDATPFYLNHDTRPWEQPAGVPRRAGVSAYGFGGTNFHVVLEEYVPGMLKAGDKQQFTGASLDQGRTTNDQSAASSSAPSSLVLGPSSPAPKPIRGILALGAETPVALKDKLDEMFRKVEGGWTPPIVPPDQAELRAKERLVIDFGTHDELLEKIVKARKAAGFDNPQAWKALQPQGIFRGSGPKPGKVAFLFPGQGSQFVNMGRELAKVSPTVAMVFAEADRVMTPILGRSLTSYIFVDASDPDAVKLAEKNLMQTAITQPAMLTLDAALAKLLGDYGFGPDLVMGHSLGEYAALTAAGIMPFADALEAAAARGAEMTKVSMGDNGWMAAVMAPLDVVQQTLKEIDGYVVAANINSYNQAVIGGASKAVEQAIAVFIQKGFQAQRIPVSHAFHTKIVAPASAPLRQVLNRLHITPPRLPLVANVTGELYPTEVEPIKDILELQIASPVQWVKGLETLYANGVRTFVEVGPKKALKGFVDDVLGSKADVVSLFSNHPKTGELASFNHVLCGLYAAGYGLNDERRTMSDERRTTDVQPAAMHVQAAAVSRAVPQPAPLPRAEEASMTSGNGKNQPVDALGALLAQALQQIAGNGQGTSSSASGAQRSAFDRNAVPLGSVVISGTGLGLPGAEKPVMDPDNAMRILRGEQFIDLIPERFRNLMLAKRVTRLVKGEDGSGHFETIANPDEVLKLAARPGSFDIAGEYGVPEKLVEALDVTTQLAIAAGLDALREAGIPLVQTYKKTTKGTFLPERWMLPEALRDETGIIFGSAFPGYDRLADEFNRYYTWENRHAQLAELEDLRRYSQDPDTLRELARRIGALREELERQPYEFDRRFLFRILAMGHSQFAEYIGARGPNTQVNAACASTTQAIALAEDWIRSGRCRRVLVVAADDVTGDHLLEWIGAGFLATGAAATDDRVDQAALPFDRRRHGMIMGMGACALVVESEDVVRERGMRGVVELLSSETGNSAYHGTRLDVDHIAQVMDRLVGTAERRFGIDRRAIAPQTVFVSHETYTPARGGSASAEVTALRHTFGPAASEIVMANTKGFTGHPMGVGVEDVIALKILEHGIVPPVPNFKEVDPELGPLTLSRGGRYPVQYALHLAAGFGSQIALTLTRRIPGSLDRVDSQPRYDRWLDDVSGYDRAETEVVKRVLRIKATGAPTRRPVASSWENGTGPVVRAYAPGDGVTTSGLRPAPMAMPAPDEAKAPARDERPAPEPVVVKTNGYQAPVAPPAPAPVAPTNGRPPQVEVIPAPAPQPVAVVVAPAPAPAPAAPAKAEDQVTAAVLAIVAEKTGYPRDMLDLDLDLEADLGIDTVKQAETFAAVRETFQIPRIENMKLRDFPTLGSVVGFVYTYRPDLAVSSQPTKDERPTTKVETTPVGVAPSSLVLGPSSDVVAEKVLAIVAEKTGYPQDMLDLDLDLEADLGVDTVKQAETFAAVRETFQIPRIENMKLRDYPTLASVIQFVRDNRPDLAVSSQPAAVSSQPTKDERPTTKVETAPVEVAPSSLVLGPSSDVVAEKVLAIVAEKTGYPTEMLDLDLDLEADLGVDTVKQAETFAAVRETFQIPRIENMKLRDYPTLASVIQFVRDNRPDLAVSSQPAASSQQPAASSQQPAPAAEAAPVTADRGLPTADVVAEKVLAIVAEKTGYPTEMLDLDLDLEADLGVDTVKQAETFAAVRETFQIPRKDDLKLRDYPTLASVIQFVRDNRPDLAVSSQPTKDERPTTKVETTPVEVAPSSLVLGPSSDVVTEKVLAIVAEKTGYPTEMLDLDLDLEADLGVDTVKQAETFAAVRETFQIPRKDDLKLRDYPTLASVIQFVRDNRPDLTASSQQPAASSEQPAPAAEVAPVAADRVLQTVYSVEDADKAPRRVPVPALRPSIDLCKATGVTFGSGSRIVVGMDRGGVGKALVNRLEKRGATVLPIDPQQQTEVLEAQLQACLAEGSVQGVYWLPALDVEPALEEIELKDWRELNRQRVKNLYLTMRALYGSVSAAGCFLVSATRLGGLHGYGAEGATAPLGGAVSGFTKAYKRERGDVLVKAVDFEVGRKTAEPAEALIAETLSDPGVVEVGYHDGLRYTVTLEERPAADGQPGMELGKDTVFVVTGAAGGITSAIVGDLAQASSGIFYLLDLTPEPKAGDPNIALFRSDKEALKRKLIDELKAAGERPTPVMIDKKIMAIEREEAALRAIETVQAAGGTTHYHSVNLLDGPAVAAVVDDVRKRYGRIDVLLHAGGIEISKALDAKVPQEFNLVFDIKADGFFSLLKAAAGMPIGATVSFSSIAGRFGNSGQTDYSSANDLLCKVTSSLRSWRPDTRAIVIDWTAWGGIGMATRGSIPKIMEMAGVDMLPPEAGIPTIRRELTAGGTRGEIVVGQRLGVMGAEFDPQGGLDVEKVAKALSERERPYLMLGQVKAAKLYGGLEVETTLDPQVQPFLYDHQIDGTPVLPGVMGTETFAELASLLAPGFRVAAIEVRFLSPFKFYRHQPRTLYLSATLSPTGNGDLVARTALRSVTEPARPGLPAREDLHFTAQVRLTQVPDEGPKAALPKPAEGARVVEHPAIYKIYFHGPAYQVLERALVDGDRVIGVMSDRLPPNTSPEEVASLMAPRLIELCFQTAGVWEMAREGAMALPLAVGSVTTYRQPEQADGARLYAVVTAVGGGGSFDAKVLDEAGNVYVELTGYRTVQLPGGVTL
ncbi:MAG: SDR family NAD(P)-dependent oxidoreductase [Kouleothrix sp.]|nr:SDR family NAD(P)-dependent oxidoreductase [Kouleothrix sp.]